MGVCPKCGLAFSYTEAELARPVWFGEGVYLEGHCHWCDVRAVVPAEKTFALEPDRQARSLE